MQLFKIIPVIIVFFFSNAVNALEAAQDSSKQPQESEKIIVAQDHPMFSVSLKSNPTTGYMWQLAEYDKSLVKPGKHTFISPHSKLMGAPGKEVWTFQVLPNAFDAKQVSTIKFVYVRPWEENMKNATSKEYQLIINPANKVHAASQ